MDAPIGEGTEDPAGSSTRIFKEPAGLATVTVANPEASWIRIDAPGFATAVAPFEPGHETPECPLEVRMKRGASVKIMTRIYDSTPAERLTLAVSAFTIAFRARTLPDIAFGVVKWSTRLDTSGTAIIDDLPAGVPLKLELQGGRRVQSYGDAVRLSIGRTLVWNCSIGSGATIAGRMIDQDGAPVANREVWLETVDLDDSREIERRTKAFTLGSPSGVHRESSTTDSNGEFRFSDLRSGSYWLGPAAKALRNPSARAICPQAVKIDVVRDGELQVPLTVWRGLFVRGKAVDDAGIGVSGVRLRPVGEAGELPFAIADLDGSFKIGPLTPGRYRVIPVGDRNLRILGDEVHASAGDVDIRFVLVPGGCVEGSVRDKKTGHRIYATITTSPALPEKFREKPYTRTDGTFSFSGLTPGVYTLTATTFSRFTGSVSGVVVKDGDTVSDLTIDVAPVK
jgi:hypothetical protein